MITIDEKANPYRDCIQGRANEPITVRALLERAEKLLKSEAAYTDLGDYSLPRIVDRLYRNCPRVAIIAGSPDHPAHLLDHEHILRAAAQIWRLGGVPFTFGIPVICDGTAQSNIGQSYSLASRNITASAININFEGHSYHAAYVLTGCDKTPMGILSGLLATDRARRATARGTAPVWAMFAPAHVLQGGRIPISAQRKIDEIVQRARDAKLPDLADDIVDNCRYILQCSSDEAFLGHFKRAVSSGILTEAQSQDLLNSLAAATCHHEGGICAFHGTGNSSRMLLAALGLVCPHQELLTRAPDTANVNQAIDLLFAQFNLHEQGLLEIVERNFANCVRIHSATGGSSNLMLHLVGMMRYAGFDVTLQTYDAIRRQQAIPDIFSHSLTDGRDTYVYAQQFAKKLHAGNDSLVKILCQLGIHMDLDAPTVISKTWHERTAALTEAQSPSLLEEEQMLKQIPIRPYSGVDVMQGNFFSTAVLKVASMSDEQMQRFDGRLFYTIYFENEDDCLSLMRDPDMVATLAAQCQQDLPLIENLAKINGCNPEVDSADVIAMIESGWLAFAFIIAGQGPEAFGMPEMFAPSQNLRHHQVLERSSILITDGRYSGVTKGACVGHMTPEAFAGGQIGGLQNGDVLWVQLSEQQINLVDRNLLREQGQCLRLNDVDFTATRKILLQSRKQGYLERRQQISSSCILAGITDAERGVVPDAVDAMATFSYSSQSQHHPDKHQLDKTPPTVPA